MAVTAAAALSGRLARVDMLPPPMAILILLVFAVSFAIGLGRTFVLFFPYVWLPAVLVTVALAGHIVVARAVRVELRRFGAGLCGTTSMPVITATASASCRCGRSATFLAFWGLTGLALRTCD